MAVTQLWHKLKFSTRITFTFGMVSFVILLIVLVTLSKSFFSDKLVYMLDVLELRGERVATQIYNSVILLERKKLGEMSGSIATETPLSKFTKTPMSMGLPRIPIGEELFLFKEGTEYYAIWSKNQIVSRLKMSPDYLLTGLGVQTANIFWATGTGEWLSEISRTGAEINFFRKAFQEYAKSGLARGTSVIKDPQTKKQMVIAFQELKLSNTVLIVASSLDEAMAPIKRAVFGVSALGLLLVVVGLLLASAFFQRSWKPLEQIEKIAGLISTGHYDVRVNYRFDDEVSKIFKSIYRMSDSLLTKETRFNTLRRNLERVAVSTRRMAIAANERDVLDIAAQTLKDSGVIGENSQIIILLPESLADTLHLNERIELVKSVNQDLLPLDIGGVTIDLIKSNKKHKFVPLAVPNSFGMLFIVKKYEPGAILFGPMKGNTIDLVEENILDAIANSISAALENQILRRQSEDKAVLDSNLEAASAVQQSLVKRWLGKEGVIQGFYYQSAQKTGGDWQGCFFDPITKCMFFYIGDVTGHGVGSALITAVVCGTLNSVHFQRRNSSAATVSTIAAEVLEQLTHTVDFVVTETGQEKLFITMILGAIDVQRNKLHYVNCGHPFPFLQIKKSEKVTFLTQNTRQLGISGPITASVNTIDFNSGDRIFMYTDGLLENHSDTGKTINKRQIIQILQENKSKKPQAVVDAIVTKSLDAWAENPFDDDVSLMLLERSLI
jgi:serine phosphatase RsbU (regulator of sigma subunit)